MKKYKFTFLLVLILGIWFAGCGVSEKGTPLENQPPNTILSTAPDSGATVDHYVILRWAGTDPDGDIAGFRLLVDSAQITFTTNHDTMIGFVADTPSDTIEGPPVAHTFSVIAVDQQGAEDPDPPVSFFFVTNIAPTVAFASTGNPDSGAVIGHAFRITLTLEDVNRSPADSFSISLKDTLSWTPWSADSVFLFLHPDLLSDASLLPRGVNIIVNNDLMNGLLDGVVTLYARVKDAGNSVCLNYGTRVLDIRSGPSPTESYAPVMNPLVTSTYGNSDIYPDGSTYYQTSAETRIAVEASADAYRGEINAYRYQYGDSIWSGWIGDPSLSYGNLPVGAYPFKFMARDYAGALSDTLYDTIRIVQQSLTDSLIIVAETAQGTGDPFTHNLVVDSFYVRILNELNLKVREIKYGAASRQQSRSEITPYLSPYDLHNAGVILWHSDDVSLKHGLSDAISVRILREFLDRGGRLILSGQDLMNSFATTGNADSLAFELTGFAYQKLRVISGRRTTGRTAPASTGIIGVQDYPSVPTDTARIRGTANGAGNRLSGCWTFYTKEECLVIGLLNTNLPTNPVYMRPAAYLYNQSFRAAVIGVPLYFCVEDSVKAFLTKLNETIFEGLTSVP
jgi:hypothetical protein